MIAGTYAETERIVNEESGDLSVDQVEQFKKFGIQVHGETLGQAMGKAQLYRHCTRHGSGIYLEKI